METLELTYPMISLSIIAAVTFCHMSALLKKDFCFSCLLIMSQSKDGMQDEEKYKDHFLGVMATDVPLNYLKEFILQPLVSLMVC